MTATRRFLPAGTIAEGADPVRLTPTDAGWTYCGLRVIALAPGESRTLDTDDTEVFVLPLSATAVTVAAAGETFELDGRTSVFARVSDFVYVGRDTEVTITSASGGEIAIPSARCDVALPPKFGSAADVRAEIEALASSHAGLTDAVLAATGDGVVAAGTGGNGRAAVPSADRCQPARRHDDYQPVAGLLERPGT
ncbi:MAG: 5-deoxy-glucuronate isomerase, partial [Ilumatobacteraceae bacterium]